MACMSIIKISFILCMLLFSMPSCIDNGNCMHEDYNCYFVLDVKSFFRISQESLSINKFNRSNTKLKKFMSDFNFLFNELAECSYYKLEDVLFIFDIGSAAKEVKGYSINSKIFDDEISNNIFCENYYIINEYWNKYNEDEMESLKSLLYLSDFNSFDFQM